MKCRAVHSGIECAYCGHDVFVTLCNFKRFILRTEAEYHQSNCSMAVATVSLLAQLAVQLARLPGGSFGRGLAG